LFAKDCAKDYAKNRFPRSGWMFAMDYAKDYAKDCAKKH
jgi:hypothetical protein